ncbi:vicilin-like seed storage protein At2g18540 [Papaver somniferum]|uniref:vicilin-like seed storage protein At2g18540 n=1 Tax=Papaver somniferum TaxID=3469 RepID=UPI000E700C6B|nr:vicilin-like seed storage protein At2g18540 [Papaver somniferum]
MESSSASNPAIPSNSDQYNQAKNQAFSLEMDELMKLKDEVQGEINRRASEIDDRQREEEERKRREDEETESMFEERSEKHQKDPKYGSSTESDSEEDSAAGYEYHVEEVNTSEEGSDVVEDRLRMEKYLDWKLRRRFEFERANPKIFARTMQEGEPKVEEKKLVLIHPRTAQVEDSSDSDENLHDASNDDGEEEDESDEEDSSSGNSDTSPASSSSSCSERYAEDEDWSYDEEDCFGEMLEVVVVVSFLVCKVDERSAAMFGVIFSLNGTVKVISSLRVIDTRNGDEFERFDAEIDEDIKHMDDYRI